MDSPRMVCHDDRRRNALRMDGRLTGIDYVELDHYREVESGGETFRRPVLSVYLLDRLPENPETWIDASNISVTGEDSTSVIPVIGDLSFVDARDVERDDRIEVTLEEQGDTSLYTLRLEGNDFFPMRDLDPRYASASFRFIDEDWASELDCLPTPSCPQDHLPVPDLDYLAKDYASFRRLLLDRLATTLPDWRDHQSPDLYLSLIEVLAYHADHLSYAQDAVATEAYLDTARFRTSVRRHVRLVDYRMHEGCNARAWIALEVEGNPSIRMDEVQFLTRPPGITHTRPVVYEPEVRDAPRGRYEVFEPLPERGWEEITEQDIVKPRRMAHRLLDEDSPEISPYQQLMSGTLRDALRVALEGDLPELASILAGWLRALLDDPGIGLAGEGAAVATGRYGTKNALHGIALHRCNRCAFQDVFPEELLQPARYRFFEAHNRISFHTWHRAECCLPKGATRATLRDVWLDEDHHERGRALDHLATGDVLILEELVNPRTGNPADVDPSHRHPVRVVRLRRRVDPLGDIPVVEIWWAAEDALPFPLVISAIGPPPRCELLDDVSVARGNVVLVDHGATVRSHEQPELLDGARTFLTVPFDPPDDVVPAQDIEWCCIGERRMDERPLRPERYAPRLAGSPLVFAEPLPGALASAQAAMKRDPHNARPQVALFSPIDRPRPWSDILTLKVEDGKAPAYERWLPRFDLLGSDADDRHFVVEIDDRGIAHIRFGDGVLGARPIPDVSYLAWYRVGGGPAGNVGREAINTLLVYGAFEGGDRITCVRNPLPARGGTAPQDVADVRLRAPHAFRSNKQRAITEDDYAAIALAAFPDRLQRAAARFGTTVNNRSPVQLFIDPFGTTADNESLRDEVEASMQRYVRIGHTLEVLLTDYVPIDLTLSIEPAPHHHWGAIKRALLDRFGSGIAPDGMRGFFHPDQFTFGQGVAMSQVIATALAVPGVGQARVTRLKKRGTPGPAVPQTDILHVRPWQVIQLENDPAHPERGVLTIEPEATP